MKAQPSTSAGAGSSKAGTSDGDPRPSDGAEESVSSTSGGSAPVQQQQRQEEQSIFFRGTSKTIQQLFGSTCRVKLQRCRFPVPIASVPKAEESSDTSGSSSASEDDEVKVLPQPAPLPKKKKAVAKKKAGKVSQRKSSSAYCTVCKKTFCSKDTLKNHLVKHTGEKRHRCEKCGRSFWSLSTFRDHKKQRDLRNGVCPPERKIIEGKPKGAWTCKTCGKRMKHPNSYLPHMKVHRGDKPFKCGECGKAFLRKADLSEHERIHSGVWNYTCVFCDKGFHQQPNLFSHLRMHTEEKPFFCEVNGCGASFRYPYSLKLHRQSIH